MFSHIYIYIYIYMVKKILRDPSGTGFTGDWNNRNTLRFQSLKIIGSWGKTIGMVIEQAAVEIGKDKFHDVWRPFLVR